MERAENRGIRRLERLLTPPERTRSSRLDPAVRIRTIGQRAPAGYDGGMPPSYGEHPLPPPLDAFVACVWFLRQERPEVPNVDVQRIPPDGTIELILHLGKPFISRTSGDAPADWLAKWHIQRIGWTQSTS